MYTIEKQQIITLSNGETKTITEYDEFYSEYDTAMKSAQQWAISDSDQIKEPCFCDLVPNENYDAAIKIYDGMCEISYRILKLIRELPHTT